MFSNIGSKIQSYSLFVSILGIVISIIIGVTSLAAGEGSLFLSALIMGLISWISGLFLSGFGQLIENVEKIANSINEKKEME